MHDLTARIVHELHGRARRARRPVVTPPQQRGHHRKQCPALLGQPVLIPGRVLAVLTFVQYTGVGEFLEAGGEHTARSPETGLEVVEPAGAAKRIPDDQQRPPLADDVQRPGDRAIPLRETRELHASQSSSLSILTRLSRRVLWVAPPPGG